VPSKGGCQPGREERLYSEGAGPSFYGSVPSGLRANSPHTENGSRTNLPESFQYNELAKNSPEKCQSHLLAHLCSFREGQQLAPGYQLRQEVMKPHYRRNVTLTIDIPLAPIPTEKD